MDRASPAAARTRPRRRLRVSTTAAAKHSRVTMGRTTASLLRSLTSRWMRTSWLDWKSTKLSPLTAGTLSKTVIPLASSSFLAVSSTWLRSMVICPPLVLTEPVLDAGQHGHQLLVGGPVGRHPELFELRRLDQLQGDRVGGALDPVGDGRGQEPGLVREGVLHPLARGRSGRPARRSPGWPPGSGWPGWWPAGPPCSRRCRCSAAGCGRTPRPPRPRPAGRPGPPGPTRRPAATGGPLSARGRPRCRSLVLLLQLLDRLVEVFGVGRRRVGRVVAGGHGATVPAAPGPDSDSGATARRHSTRPLPSLGRAPAPEVTMPEAPDATTAAPGRRAPGSGRDQAVDVVGRRRPGPAADQLRILAFWASNSASVMTPFAFRSASLASSSALLPPRHRRPASRSRRTPSAGLRPAARPARACCRRGRSGRPARRGTGG